MCVCVALAGTEKAAAKAFKRERRRMLVCLSIAAFVRFVYQTSTLTYHDRSFGCSPRYGRAAEETVLSRGRLTGHCDETTDDS